MKIHYAGIIINDFVDGFDGVTLSFWTQGCPYHCKGCHNPQTWDFNGGIEKEYIEIESYIINHIKENGLIRNFSILGGEPLCEHNIYIVAGLIRKVREEYPDIKIFIWTGNLYENLIKDNSYKILINPYIDYLIDGPYEEDKRDIRLLLRGSSNQRVIDIKKTLESNQIVTLY